MHDELHKHRTLWLATALHAFTHIYQVALIPLYLLVQHDFALASEGQATFLVTALSVAYFLPSYPMGILADRFSRKKLLGLGLAINAVGFVMVACSSTYVMAVVGMILAGLGGSFFHPSATALVARLFPTQTGKALGKMGIGASIGFFIGPIYSGWRAAYAGWRQPVLELGIAGVIAAGLFMWLAKEHPAPPPGDHQEHNLSRKLFATPRLWLIFLVMSFIFCLRDFAGSGMASLGSLFLQHAHGFDAKHTGLLIGIIFLASAISNPLFGHLSDRGRLRSAAFLLVAAAITIFIFPRVPKAGIAPTLAAYGFFFMATYPVVEAALMESVHDSIRGRVFGLFITIGGLLGNLSHWIVGAWVTRLGDAAHVTTHYITIYNTLAFFVIVSLLGLACLHALRKKEQAQGEPMGAAPVLPLLRHPDSK